MPSLVLELQSDCLNKELLLTDLLRKAYFIARKLSVDDFKDWTRNELDGYKNTQKVPLYREAYCELKAWNPYRGWIPMIIQNNQFEEMVRKVTITQPISEIEKLKQSNSDQSSLKMSLTGSQITTLQSIFKCDFNFELFLPSTTPNKICDSVKTVILEWSLKLEEQGILGENFSFTNEEKNIANNNSAITIQNFQGILGNVINSKLEQNLDFHINKGNENELAEILRNNQIKESDIKEIIEALKSDPLPKTSENLGKKVSGWIGKMIGKAVDGTWKISVSVATNLLTKAIYQYYGFS